MTKLCGHASGLRNFLMSTCCASKWPKWMYMICGVCKLFLSVSHSSNLVFSATCKFLLSNFCAGNSEMSGT